MDNASVIADWFCSESMLPVFNAVLTKCMMDMNAIVKLDISETPTEFVYKNT